MPGAVLPPFASPAGPELTREQLIDAFLGGSRTGFSDDLHIEGAMLMADRMVPFGVRLGERSLLLRGDLSPGIEEIKREVEALLRSRGLTIIEPDARLGDIAAIQVTGVRGGIWDLWGHEGPEAQRDLERAALGGDLLGPRAIGEGLEDSGVGMTLEELLGEGPDDAGGMPPQARRSGGRGKGSLCPASST